MGSPMVVTLGQQYKCYFDEGQVIGRCEGPQNYNRPFDITTFTQNHHAGTPKQKYRTMLLVSSRCTTYLE